MKFFNVSILGTTPLMHHKFSEEEMVKLMKNTKAKKDNVKPIDNEPRETALSHCYYDDKGCYCPSSFIRGAFRHVSADYKQTKGKRTYKAIAGGIFTVVEPKIYILNPKTDEIINPDKFEVDIQIAVNHKAGAVVVCRPRFDSWKLNFQCGLDTDLIDKSTALEILQDAGRRSGIGSYRVSKSGSYGQFDCILFEEIK